jgi:hypothetical protein
MPAFRNVGPSRHSGRLVKEIPVIWDSMLIYLIFSVIHLLIITLCASVIRLARYRQCSPSRSSQSP